ncbi:protein-L-isoaspartate O-methyltransferase 1-like [Salvia miltiorrhiza]|uniref:protein-L-isoaspartate O-methyltransferase 1-like n=1 Tax=Salvia miltiorrhiza TaxID=226208 RepID=UPI0025AC8CFA|nr:protein-L-isoaspartate O-methyltransferase 1-like [Salvia miltiorrhiza]XP_057787936.1 protein-L-isoaspartate O-methyltransferase 1-like [Salvia miltiorrhiza]XP_057787937.1 protein-L-isoaspartate O-methyltransferase 1-like [Salvia miltiorrhiza]
MHSSSHYSSLSVIASHCSYRTPLGLSYLYLTHRRFHHRPPLKLAAAITAFSYRRCRFAYPYLLTGNSLLSRMERFWAGSGVGRNQEMVSHLQSSGVIRSKKVAEVMETIDRALFVPAGAQPYVDSPMPIGHNATISAPHMHAMCLELLENHLKPGMCALDVGSGTGYLTACLALMVGPEGHSVGVEHIPELVESSIKSIQKSAAAPLLKEGSLSIHAADGRQGWPEHAPYDAIHVGAAAPEIPPALIEQLKPGGRLVIPVGNIFQDLQVVDKKEDGSLSVRSETSVRYVPLTSREAQTRGHQY